MNTLIQKPILWVLDLVYPIFKKILPYPIYSYLAVGAMNTALNIILFALFYQFILPKQGLFIGSINLASTTLALVISFILTVPTGFWLNRNFAFAEAKKDTNQSATQSIKYFLVVLQGLFSDWSILTGLVLYLGIYPTVAKVLSTMIVLTLNYLLQKHFTFKTKEAEN